MDKGFVGGMSFCGTLGLIFVVLKLVGVIDWSWWWVLLPWYGPFIVTVIVFLAIAAVFHGAM